MKARAVVGGIALGAETEPFLSFDGREGESEGEGRWLPFAY